MAIKLSVAARNALLDAITTTLGNGGLLKIYDGTRPANVATAVSTQTLLGTLTGASPFAPPSSAGVLTASAITQDSSADATGTAAWYRLCTSGGTGVIDGDIAAGSGDLSLNTVSIVIGGPILCTSYTLTAPNA